MLSLASDYQALGKLDKSLPLQEEGFALAKAKLGPDDMLTILMQRLLVKGYLLAKRSNEARQVLGEFLSGQRRRQGADAPAFAGSLASASDDLLQAGMFADAEPLLRETLAIHEAKEPNAWITFNTRSMLGAALLGQKKYDEAEPLLRSGYEGMKQRADKIPLQFREKRLGQALDCLITLAEATNKPDEAKAWREERASLPADATPKPK
jgi:hypothetical protein